ncbi:MAG: ATP-dependent Clp protease ATP-binding subunit, partial [Firmicutes bacterium]|nr:ATP-dependent Clp protease ATP-binding subunit [Bacillota bacterium]
MENMGEGGMEGLEQMFPPEMLNMMMGAAHPGEDGEDSEMGIMPGEEDTAEAENGSDKKVKTNKKKNSNLKTLSKFGTNLTEKAANGEIDNIVGRSLEIDRLMQILNRRSKNNPVLLGEPGVGKTAIAEGFALLIARGEVPVKLQDKQVYLLDMTGLVAGTQFRGQFEARMKAIINEVTAAKNVILVIDE